MKKKKRIGRLEIERSLCILFFLYYSGLDVTEMEKVLILFNDSSGKNEGKAIAQQLANSIQTVQSDWKVELQPSNADIKAETIRKKAHDMQATRLVFIGGDGTIHHLVKTFKDELDRYVVGIIPGGTVNNFARSLELPLEQEAAFEVIANGQIKAVDYGLINQEDVIISTLTIGILADTAVRVTQEEKQTYGPFAFAKRFVKLWFRKKRYHLTITTDEQVWKGKVALLTITMTNSAGGYVHFDPNATPDDGEMHVTILEKLSVLQAFRLLPLIILGKVDQIADVVYFSSPTIKIEATERKVETRTDGDPTAHLPVTLEVQKQGMKVLIPEKESK